MLKLKVIQIGVIRGGGGVGEMKFKQNAAYSFQPSFFFIFQ